MRSSRPLCRTAASNFATSACFEVKKRAARKARNPRTGEKVFVKEKFVVTFKPGKEMEERVHELERQHHAAQAAAAAGQAPPPTGTY